MDCLTRMHRRKEEKYDTICTHPGRDARITTWAKLLNIKYKFLWIQW